MAFAPRFMTVSSSTRKAATRASRLRLALTSTAALLLAVNPAGCDCGAEPLEEPVCNFVVTPSGTAQAIDFGGVEVGQEATRSWRIENTGNVPLPNLLAQLEPVNGENYEVEIPDDLQVNPDDDATLTVTFRPLAAAANLASLFVVAHNNIGAADCPAAQVTLRGSGFVAPPVDAGVDAGVIDGGPLDDAGFVDAGFIDPDGGVVVGPDAEWRAYGAFEEARSRFATVKLTDGTVLAIGGTGEAGRTLDTIERFDPTTGRSRVVATMAIPRSEPGAAVLADGRVVIAGGRNQAVGGFAITTVEVLDPDDDFSLTCPPPQAGCGVGDLDSGALPDGRIGPFVFATGNSVVVALGRGLDEETPPAEVPLAGGVLLNVAGTISPGVLGNANLLTARTGEARVLNEAGTGFLLIGGRTQNGSVIGSVLGWQGVSNSISNVGTLDDARAEAAAAVLEDGTVLVTGGLADNGAGLGTVERILGGFSGPVTFDVIDGLALPPRAMHTAVALPGDIVLVAGGVNRRTDNLDADESVLPLSTADILVPFGAAGFLRLATDNGLAQGRVDHQAVVVGEASDPQVLFLGGSNTSPRRTPHPHAERFLPLENRFLTYGLMGPGTAYAESVVVDSGAALISVGGVDPHTGAVSDAVRAFDATGGRFVEVGELNSARRDHTATALPDTISLLIVGGRDDSGQVLGTASIFNTLTGVDRPLPVSLARARANHTATTLVEGPGINEGAVLLCGGQGAGLEAVDSCEVFAFTPAFVPQNPDTYDEASFERVRGRLSTGRVAHTATLLPDSGEVLIVGGGDVEVDLVRADLIVPDEDGPLIVTTGLPGQARRGHGAVYLGGGRVLVAGGEVFDGAAVGPTRSAELYVRQAGTFVDVADMEEPRVLPLLVLLEGGDVLVAGGAQAGPDPVELPTRAQFSNELYVAAPDGTGVFESLSDLELSYGRADAPGVNLFGRSIAAGGTHRDGRIENGTERRTPQTFVDMLENPDAGP